MRRVLAALALVWSAACAPKLIPETNILATPDNEAILKVVAQYRQALEGRNVEGIVKLTSKDFFENSGTPEPSDDYNREGLERRLKGWAEQVKAVRASFEVRSVRYLEEGQARAAYFFDVSYQIEGTGGPIWKRDTDVKEMRLKKESDGVWRIVSGI
jgi:ketosteroid isomerase-like protein